MPALRNQMRRISILYREIRDHSPITQKELLDRVNQIVEPDMRVCKSTIEKDLFKMKMDFDVEIISSRRGYKLAEEIDFKEKVIEYFNIHL